MGDPRVHVSGFPGAIHDIWPIYNHKVDCYHCSSQFWWAGCPPLLFVHKLWSTTMVIPVLFRETRVEVCGPVYLSYNPTDTELRKYEVNSGHDHGNRT